MASGVSWIWTISFIYMRNRIVLSIQPCGMPNWICYRPFTTACCGLSLKRLSMRFKAIPTILCVSGARKCTRGSMDSKAFLKSRKVPTLYREFSMLPIILYLMFMSLWVLLIYFLNKYFFAITLFHLKKARNSFIYGFSYLWGDKQDR